MPDQPFSWVPIVGAIVGGISGIGVIASFAHNFEKDRGINARRTRILEQAKVRTEIWRARIDVQLRTLSGNDLLKAKEEANDALEKIRGLANHNLEEVARGRKAATLIGVGAWRRWLLFYKPAEAEGGLLWVAILTRVMFWITLLPLPLYLWLGGWLVWLLIKASPDARADAFRRVLYSHKAHAFEALLAFTFVSLLILAAVHRFQARSLEGHVPDIKEIDEI